MNRITHLGLCLTVSVSAAMGQVIEERLAPKMPPKQSGKVKLPEPATPASNPEDEAQVAERLNGIVVVKSKEDVKTDGLEAMTGLEVRDVPVLEGPGFAKVVEPYFGKPVSIRTLKEIQRKIILYCREQDRPLVDVIVPNQEVKNGVVQLVLIEGRVGNISVRNEEPQWFKEAVITRGIRATSGDVIRERELLSDVNWLNRNPFREVGLAFKQGDRPGLSDLQLQVEDRLPLRGFVGYENTGSEVTGEDRLIAGFNWGNAFGLDHQLNYQFTTDPTFDLLTAHSGSYAAPLPWRHTLTLFASYVDITAESVNTSVDQAGKNYQASFRYAIPLPLLKNYQHEVSVGFDFKHNESELIFNTRSVPDTETDVGQVAAGYSGLLSDAWGRTSIGLQGYYSPGDLYGKNTDEDFNAAHLDAEADYYYGRLTAERITRLPWDLSLILRGTGQAASGNLIASEQLGVGGFNSVRGYDEREVNGDRGFFGNVELRSPPWSLVRFFNRSKSLQKAKLFDQFQLLAFVDYGMVENVDPIRSVPADPGDPLDPDDDTLAEAGETTSHLLSVGGGFRYTMSRYLSVRFDYGVQLRDSGLATASSFGSRGHIGVIASF